MRRKAFTEVSHELGLVFGEEWAELDTHRQHVIARDYWEACQDYEVDAAIYHDRIGSGNLKAYGDVMLVREKQGWK